MNNLAEKVFLEVMQSRLEFVDDNALKEFVTKLNAKAWFFRSCPFIQEVAICNNLSFGLVNQDSDIDLFFVLDSKRFFLARLWISLGLQLLGLRRYKNKVKGRFCLSFFVAENCLDLTELRLNDKDYYFYFWFKNLCFLRDNQDLQTGLKVSNQGWFLDDFSSQLKLKLKSENFVLSSFQPNKVAQFWEFIFGLKIFDLLERVLGYWQLARAKQKNMKLNNPVGVKIEPGLLKFHVLDARSEINQLVENYFSLLK